MKIKLHLKNEKWKSLAVKPVIRFFFIPSSYTRAKLSLRSSISTSVFPHFVFALPEAWVICWRPRKWEIELWCDTCPQFHPFAPIQSRRNVYRLTRHLSDKIDHDVGQRWLHAVVCCEWWHVWYETGWFFSPVPTARPDSTQLNSCRHEWYSTVDSNCIFRVIRLGLF